MLFTVQAFVLGVVNAYTDMFFFVNAVVLVAVVTFLMQRFAHLRRLLRVAPPTIPQ
jgi:hypothetical protein